MFESFPSEHRAPETYFSAGRSLGIYFAKFSLRVPRELSDKLSERKGKFRQICIDRESGQTIFFLKFQTADLESWKSFRLFAENFGKHISTNLLAPVGPTAERKEQLPVENNCTVSVFFMLREIDCIRALFW